MADGGDQNPVYCQSSMPPSDEGGGEIHDFAGGRENLTQGDSSVNE